MEMVNYTVRSETLSQHLGWTNVMSSILRVARAEALYLDEDTPVARKRAM